MSTTFDPRQNHTFMQPFEEQQFISFTRNFKLTTFQPLLTCKKKEITVKGFLRITSAWPEKSLVRKGYHMHMLFLLSKNYFTWTDCLWWVPLILRHSVCEATSQHRQITRRLSEPELNSNQWIIYVFTVGCIRALKGLWQIQWQRC